MIRRVANADLSDRFSESWRVAEEGTRVVARRCSCPEPILDPDADDFVTCALCGREPSVRLGPAQRDTNGTREVSLSPRLTVRGTFDRGTFSLH
jgi:hypothetical protein